MYLLQNELQLQPLQTGDWVHPLVGLRCVFFTVMEVLMSESLFVSVKQAHRNPDHSLNGGLKVLIDSQRQREKMNAQQGLR